MKYAAVIDGLSLDVELNRASGLTIEGKVGNHQYVLGLTSVEPGVYWVEWNNRSIEISVTPIGDKYVVSIEGRSISVEIVDTRAALRKAALHAQSGTVELRAPMPGKVVKVLVAEGVAVEVNQSLLVIEAMKMQNEVKSPKKGIVKKVDTAEGSAVSAGDLLAIVE